MATLIKVCHHDGFGTHNFVPVQLWGSAVKDVECIVRQLKEIIPLNSPHIVEWHLLLNVFLNHSGGFTSQLDERNDYSLFVKHTYDPPKYQLPMWTFRSAQL
jgi:hypothetical protein